MSTVLVYFGAVAILVWGLGHLMPTRAIVAGFGRLTPDNSRIITMEWIAEGLTLCFIGLLAVLVAPQVADGGAAATVVLRACAGMLVALALLSGFTGARTSSFPMKLCPFVKSAVAVLFVAGTLTS